MDSETHLTPAFDDETLLAEARALRKKGELAAMLALLGDALRRDRLSPEAMETVGRMVAKAREKSPPSSTPLRILVLGQCTTPWLSFNLVAMGLKHQAVVDVTDGAYDNVLQELMTLEGAGTRFDVAVLLPWNTRLLGEGTRDGQTRIDDELMFWSQVWERVRSLGAQVVQVGYDLMGRGPEGLHLSGTGEGRLRLVREINDQLRQQLPERSFFVDLESIAGELGRKSFYSARRYYWTKQPFSEAGTSLLAEHVWAGIRALVSGPKKVLVLDLDNTLWGGVVGETGPLGIGIGESPEGEAFRAFQREVKSLSTRGVILAVSSKNNPEDAREPFEKNPDMILKLEDFAVFEANWEPKPEALRRIARELNLGLDSFVFFDDNPAEAENVRQALPEVAVVDVPADPSRYIEALAAGLWFETVALTAEDQARSQQYQIERQRKEVRASNVSMEDYLRSLEMIGEVRTIDETDLTRVVQLIGKTNQFNLTTRRHSLDDVRALLKDPRAIGLTMRIADRFGDYGLISVLIAVPDDEAPETTLRIDTWLMSCRVIARTAEEGFFLQLMNLARTLGFKRLRGEYIPTPKNELVRELFPRLGFELTGKAGEAEFYERAVDDGASIQTFVRVENGS